MRPTYLPGARRAGAQGTMMLRVHVGADGRIVDVLVDVSAGHPDLDRAAMDACGAGSSSRPAAVRSRSPCGSASPCSYGRRLEAPVSIHAAGGSIPDHLGMAVNPQGQAVIVWQDATAVRRRVMLRTATDGGRTLGPPRTLSQAIKAFAPAVVATPSGDFVVAWHEEAFPAIRTVVQPVRLAPLGR